MIAEAWDCSTSVVVWSLVAQWLAKLRGRKVDDVPYSDGAKDVLRKFGSLSLFQGEVIDFEDGSEEISDDGGLQQADDGIAGWNRPEDARQG
jgi:hypothetical protein